MADSLLKALLARVTAPLVPQVEQAADTTADTITTPHLAQSPTMARLKGFGAGALQGAGHLLSDMTSPLNLALMAPTLGMGGAAEAAAEPAVEAAPAALRGVRKALSPIEQFYKANPAAKNDWLGVRTTGNFVEGHGGLSDITAGNIKRVPWSAAQARTAPIPHTAISDLAQTLSSRHPELWEALSKSGSE